MTGSLTDAIQERLSYYKNIIADLEAKNANLARLACTYAVEVDKAKIRTPQEYAAYHGDMRRDRR